MSWRRKWRRNVIRGGFLLADLNFGSLRHCKLVPLDASTCLRTYAGGDREIISARHCRRPARSHFRQIKSPLRRHACWISVIDFISGPDACFQLVGCVRQAYKAYLITRTTTHIIETSSLLLRSLCTIAELFDERIDFAAFI